MILSRSATERSTRNSPDLTLPFQPPLVQLPHVQSTPVRILRLASVNVDREPTSSELSHTQSGHSWSVLGHMENLARGCQETKSHLQRLNNVQECVRMEVGAMGVRGQDGLTRQQRYDQRVAARELQLRSLWNMMEM
eukprot:jgi/Botrbrau1/23034/Bobra.136_1s0023.1